MRAGATCIRPRGPTWQPADGGAGSCCCSKLWFCTVQQRLVKLNGKTKLVFPLSLSLARRCFETSQWRRPRRRRRASGRARRARALTAPAHPHPSLTPLQAEAPAAAAAAAPGAGAAAAAGPASALKKTAQARLGGLGGRRPPRPRPPPPPQRQPRRPTPAAADACGAPRRRQQGDYIAAELEGGKKARGVARPRLCSPAHLCPARAAGDRGRVQEAHSGQHPGVLRVRACVRATRRSGVT